MNIWKVLEPIKVMIRMIFNRAILDTINNSTDIQLLKVSIMEGEVKDQIERLEDYGFTSVPKSGSEVLLGFIGGNKNQGIAIRVGDSRVRLKSLDAGEVAMYHESGTYIKLNKTGGIEISSSENVTIKNSGTIMLGSDTLNPGGNGGDGVVTGKCNCAFTGAPHPIASTNVMAKL